MGYTATNTLFDHPVKVRDKASTPNPGAGETHMVRLPTGTLPSVAKCYTADKVLVKLPREWLKNGVYTRCPVAKNETYAYAAAQSLGWDIVPEVLDPRCVFPGPCRMVWLLRGGLVGQSRSGTQTSAFRTTQSSMPGCMCSRF